MKKHWYIEEVEDEVKLIAGYKLVEPTHPRQFNQTEQIQIMPTFQPIPSLQSNSTQQQYK